MGHDGLHCRLNQSFVMQKCFIYTSIQVRSYNRESIAVPDAPCIVVYTGIRQECAVLPPPPLLPPSSVLFLRQRSRRPNRYRPAKLSNPSFRSSSSFLSVSTPLSPSRQLLGIEKSVVMQGCAVARNRELVYFGHVLRLGTEKKVVLRRRLNRL